MKCSRIWTRSIRIEFIFNLICALSLQSFIDTEECPRNFEQEGKTLTEKLVGKAREAGAICGLTIRIIPFLQKSLTVEFFVLIQVNVEIWLNLKVFNDCSYSDERVCGSHYDGVRYVLKFCCSSLAGFWVKTTEQADRHLYFHVIISFIFALFRLIYLHIHIIFTNTTHHYMSCSLNFTEVHGSECFRSWLNAYCLIRNNFQ